MLTFFQTILGFQELEQKPFWNIVGKGKMLETSIFSFAHNFFHSIREKLHPLSNTEIVVYKSFQFGQG